MIPNLVEKPIGGAYDHEGWTHGRAAADLASLQTATPLPSSPRVRDQVARTRSDPAATITVGVQHRDELATSSRHCTPTLSSGASDHLWIVTDPPLTRVVAGAWSAAPGWESYRTSPDLVFQTLSRNMSGACLPPSTTEIRKR